MDNLLFRDPETLKASVDVALFALHYQEVLNQGTTHTTNNSTGVIQDFGKILAKLKQLHIYGVSLIMVPPEQLLYCTVDQVS